MAATAGNRLGTLAAIVHNQQLNIRCNQLCSLLQVRNYAARKGTREKAKKKKVKVEVKKVGYIPYHLRFKEVDMIHPSILRKNDSWKSDAIDDVWLGKYHKWKIYPFAEAVECHRETHHPTCYNLPNAFINAHIELDMQGEKETKIVEGFSRTVEIPHIFDHGEKRTIMAFAKDPVLLDLANKAGATICGNTQLISKIQAGEVSINDYSAVVAHPEIMAELSVIRGLMKRKFPNPRTETLGLNLDAMIRKILHGIQYKAIPHERQKLCGRITVPIGRLPMDAKHLEENFVAVIKDVETVKPKREGPFITRASLTCPPSTELLKINFEQYFIQQTTDDTSYDSDDDDEIIRSNAI